MSLLDAINKDGTEESGKLYGVVVGIVSNTKDEEGLGRVKIDLPCCWLSQTAIFEFRLGSLHTENDHLIRHILFHPVQLQRMT